MKYNIKNIIKNGKLRYILIYTVVFSFILTIGYSVFIFGHIRFIHYSDPLMQHYPALIYFGQYLRELPGNLLSGIFPMYDFSIGMGDDIIATLMMHSANVDIFNLLFAFVSRDNAYVMYIIVVILRLYFSGLTFSYFSYTILRTNKTITLMSAIIYVFSGWTLGFSLFHPSFMIILFYLPLVIAGFDKIIQNQKPYLFIITVFLLGLASFYFLYMATILIIGYAFVRIHHLYSGNYIKNIVKYGIKSTAYYLVGLMMAAITFLPLVIAHFNTGRETYISLDSLLYYSAQDYLFSLLSYPAPHYLGNVLASARILGLSAIVPVALILLLFQKPVKKHLITGVIITFIFQIIPMGNLILNGFGYVTNRVEIIYNFIYCIAFAIMLRDYQKPSKKAIIAVTIYIAILLRALMFFYNTYYFDSVAITFLLAGLGFIILFTLLLIMPADNPKFKFLTEKRRVSLINLVIVINLTINITTYYLFSDAFLSKNVEDVYEDYVSVSDYVDDDTFFRQGTPFAFSWYYFSEHQYRNASILFDYYGVSEYWTLMNPAYCEFNNEMENVQQSLRWSINSLDNRTVLNEITSVKYIFASSNFVPYGYEKVAELPYRYLYYNTYALPLGYTYNYALSREQYDELHPLDKQNVLLQAVVLTDEFANIDVSDIVFDKTQIPYTPYLEDGIILKLQNETICSGNCETYIYLVGYECTDKSTYFSSITAGIPSLERYVTHGLSSENHEQFLGRNNHLMNLGYSEIPVSEIEIDFSDINFTFDSLEIFCVPMDNYPEQAEALRDDVLENVIIDVNSVKGDITLEEEKILVLSIPYSNGWSLKVNGEKIELLQANTAFIAVILPPGEHNVELTYETPGIRAGAIITCVGFIAFIGILIFNKKSYTKKTVLVNKIM